jgi:exo-beta-1,3-glucanase (GH17 family)
MEVFVGIYNMASDDHEAYQRQRDLIKDAIETYGTKHIAGVTVGNEFMLKCVDSLRYPMSRAATDANW